jgi:hypothetical protein
MFVKKYKQIHIYIYLKIYSNSYTWSKTESIKKKKIANRIRELNYKNE